MNKQMRGFTIIELLVVIAVIAILSTLAFAGLAKARVRAKKARLMEQMRHLAIILNDYHSDNEYRWPHRLSLLFPEYAGDPHIFLDPMDPYEGKEGCKPPLALDQYLELDEGPNLDKYYPNAVYPKEVHLSSFVYPFANVTIDDGFKWYLLGSEFTEKQMDVLNEQVPGGGSISWKEGKIFQLKHADSWARGQGVRSYPSHWFPIIRSFWSMDDPNDKDEEHVAVVSEDAFFWWSTPKWENDVLKLMNKATD